jgi:hypothetical protein
VELGSADRVPEVLKMSDQPLCKHNFDDLPIDETLWIDI